MKVLKSFAPINGLFILLELIRIAIQLSLGWEFLGPMKHKKYSILQSNRMTILMTNGIGGFIPSFILDILMRTLELDVSSTDMAMASSLNI